MENNTENNVTGIIEENNTEKAEESLYKAQRK